MRRVNESGEVEGSTYHFVLLLHRAPSSRAFIGHFLWLGIRPQLSSDVGASSLHVQEVWSQGALWCVRVMLGSLALLLGVACRFFDGERGFMTSQQASLDEGVGQANVEGP